LQEMKEKENQINNLYFINHIKTSE